MKERKKKKQRNECRSKQMGWVNGKIENRYKFEAGQGKLRKQVRWWKKKAEEVANAVKIKGEQPTVHKPPRVGCHQRVVHTNLSVNNAWWTPYHYNNLHLIKLSSLARWLDERMLAVTLKKKGRLTPSRELDFVNGLFWPILFYVNLG